MTESIKSLRREGRDPQYNWQNSLDRTPLQFKQERCKRKCVQTWLSKAEAFPTDGFYVLNYETRSPASWKSGQVGERDVNNLREVKVWMVNPESVKCSCEVWGHELKPAGVWFFFQPSWVQVRESLFQQGSVQARLPASKQERDTEWENWKCLPKSDC